MKLSKLWEDRIKRESSEEVIYGRFLGRVLVKSLAHETIEEYQKMFCKDILGDVGIKSGITILDVGVGPLARFSRLFVESNARVVSIDISMTILKEARKNVNNSGFVLADVMNLPLKNELFDVTFCYGTVYHMPNKRGVERAIREMARVTKGGGVIYFDLENYLNPINWQWIIGAKVLRALKIPLPPHVFFSYSDIIKINRGIGLKIVDIRTTFDFWGPIILILPSSISILIAKLWSPIEKRLSKTAKNHVFFRVIGVHWHLKVKRKA